MAGSAARRAVMKALVCIVESGLGFGLRLFCLEKMLSNKGDEPETADVVGWAGLRVITRKGNRKACR
jgi:hypothetical protein